MDPQNYYRSQSEMTDPGDYAALFDALPDDLTGLCQTVRNITIHYRAGAYFNYDIPQDRLVEIDTRRTDLILKRVMELDSQPLTVKRPSEKRFVGCCRDASILLCSMLRHKGIPARIRYGFAPYLRKDDFNGDHAVVEYWEGSRWKLVDAERSDRYETFKGERFDTQDIPRTFFLTGGTSWLRARSGQDNPMRYGVDPNAPHLCGLAEIGFALLIDIAMLNKVEMLLWDVWGIGDPFYDRTADDMALLDRAAVLSDTAHDDTNFEAIRTIYQDSRLTMPGHVTTYSPVQEPQSITLYA